MSLHDDLVGELYAILVGESGWDKFLSALTADLPEGKAVMMLHGLGGTAAGELSVTHGVSDSARADYAAYFSQINPWVPDGILRDARHRAIADTEVISRADLHRTEYYRDYLLPQDIQGSAGLTLSVQGQEAVVLSMMTGDRDPVRAAQMAGRLTRLMPHLARVISYHGRMRVASDPDVLSLTALDRIGVGVGLVDRNERLVHLSDRGAELAEAHGLMPAISWPRFRFRDPQARAVLQDMLRRDYAGPADVVVQVGGVRLTFFRPPQAPMSDLISGPVVGFLLSPLQRVDAQDLLEAARRRYRLTPAEVRVLDGIVQGRDIRDMAGRHGVSVETIRSQMKSLLHKTGAPNQLAVMRLVAFGLDGPG